jgi:hypothetical protein
MAPSSNGRRTISAPFTGTVTVDAVLVYARFSAAPATLAKLATDRQRMKEQSLAEVVRNSKRISESRDDLTS